MNEDESGFVCDGQGVHIWERREVVLEEGSEWLAQGELEDGDDENSKSGTRRR